MQKLLCSEKPIHPWEFPSQPWERLHIDYAGTSMDFIFLIILVAHSKWPEIIPTTSTSSATTIRILRDTFSRVRLAHILVSDNGAQFKSMEFEKFLQQNGVHHKFSALYHPADDLNGVVVSNADC
jgi:hypothetical protein